MNIQSEQAKQSAFTFLFILIMAAGVVFRFSTVTYDGKETQLSWFDLSQRPMHTDEAVQANKLGFLIDDGEYIYNSQEYHGPALNYFSLPFAWLGSKSSYIELSETTLRMVPATFSLITILLTLLLLRGMGRPAVLVAATLTVFSHAMVFYSRYYIHESLLVCFSMLTFAGGWNYYVSKQLRWAIITGIGVALMHATKETAIIAWFSMLIGVKWVIYEKLRKGELIETIKNHVKPAHFAIGFACYLVIWFLLFTSFFSNMQGATDSLETFFKYIRRGLADTSHGGANFHHHDWYYYLHLLLWFDELPPYVWSECLIFLLAIAGTFGAFYKKGIPGVYPRLAHFLSIYTWMMVLIYAFIPYKTPWCMLSFLHGMILLAGIGTVFIAKILPGKILKIWFYLLLAICVMQLGKQTWRGIHLFRSDPRNPYVYAHTSSSTLKLSERIHQLAKVHPDGRKMEIKMIASPYDTWPMPWYLRDYPKAGYWPVMPDDPNAAVVITRPEIEEQVVEKLEGDYISEFYGLRPEVLLVVYIRMDLWEKFIESRQTATGQEK